VVKMALLMLSLAAPACASPLDVRDMPQELSLPTRPAQETVDTCTPFAEALATRPVKLRQTFSEPFDRLDLVKTWSPHHDGGYEWMTKRYLSASGDEQIYVDRGFKGTSRAPLGLNPFHIDNGVLSIVGEPVPPKLQRFVEGRKYMSGMLTTRQSLVQTYGYFEMRARIPGGQGLWPAFWLLPADKFSWPPELDIIESLGRDPETIYMTAHWKKNGTGAQQHSGCKFRQNDATRAFRTYGALWEPEQITYYIDRKPIGSIKTPPGMDQPMYMIVNLGLGGHWGGMIDQTTPFPVTMEVDHIAAWALENGPAVQTKRTVQ
ncbi:MAG: glycoside hydrolase family 16 protein, partial [Caulobacterales bacterium]